MTRSQFPSSTCSMNRRAASRVHVLYIAFRNLLLVLSSCSCSCTFLYVIFLGSPTLPLNQLKTAHKNHGLIRGLFWLQSYPLRAADWTNQTLPSKLKNLCNGCCPSFLANIHYMLISLLILPLEWSTPENIHPILFSGVEHYLVPLLRGKRKRAFFSSYSPLEYHGFFSLCSCHLGKVSWPYEAFPLFSCQILVHTITVQFGWLLVCLMFSVVPMFVREANEL